MRNPDGNQETEGALLWGAEVQFLNRTLFGCFRFARRDPSLSSFAQDDVENVGFRHVRLPERHPEGALVTEAPGAKRGSAFRVSLFDGPCGVV